MATPKKNRKGLGRGLDSILPTNPPAKEPAKKASSPLGVSEIPIDQIETNPFQPRSKFDEDALKELSESIKVHGIIQPITVRKLSNKEYQLIAGERRLRASKLAKLKTVPAYIREANDEQMLEMALIENIQREDLNPIEIALSYQRMITELDLKQSELGEKVGKKRSSVTNYLRLLKLPEEIMLALKTKTISFGHGRTLIGVEDARQQLSLFDAIMEESLSVRQVEARVQALKEQGKEKTKAEKQAAPSSARIHLDEVEKNMEEKFGNRVVLAQKKDGRGEIRIPFSNTEDLNRILEILDL
ncbi:MAG: ParB/RepB/Spo0J family partition protein [Bacteroidota bacterium]